MGPSRKRPRLDEAPASLPADADAILASLPLNDLHQPDLSAADPDLDGPPHISTVGAGPSSTRSLFIRGLALAATDDKLTAFVSESFFLKHATVVLDPVTKKSKGYGFVTLADAADVAAAKEALNGSTFLGKKIRVDVAEPRKRIVDEAVDGGKRSRPAPAALEAKAKRDEAKPKEEFQAPPKLIVRNLPFELTDPEELAVLFRGFGKVKFVTLPKTPKGEPAGFGFITMRGRKNAEKALEAVNGKEVAGRTLAVDWAVEKAVWEGQKERDDKKEAAKEPEANQDDGAEDVLSDGDGGVDIVTGKDDEPALDEDEDEAEDEDEDPEVDGASGAEPDEQQDTDTATTLFVRNLPFTLDDTTLYEHFRTFGPLRYARVVFDSATGYSRGSGFVCFHRPDDAAQCVRDAPKTSTPASATKGKNAKPSLLENTLADTDGRYTMDGRVLSVARAVPKNEASRLAAVGKDQRAQRDRDKRRLFLLSEGTIAVDAPLAKVLTAAERKMRDDSAKQRQTLIKGNPSLHISLTRLAIRNIPRFVTSKDLKALARQAVVGFATDVKEGRRAPLSKEELSRGGEAMKEAEHKRKTRGQGIVSQAKVVFESKEGSKVSDQTGGGRSRGYGFIEYATHRSALMGLRYLNGYRVEPPSADAHADGKENGNEKGKDKENGNVKGKGKGSTATVSQSDNQSHPTNAHDQPKRLIAEFAIENAQVVARRRDRQERGPSGGRPEGRADGAREAAGAQRNGTRNAAHPRAAKAGQLSVPSQAAGSKRKRADTNAEVEQPPTTDNGGSQAGAADDDTKAQRNRIIGRKRAKRRRGRAS